VRLPTATDGPQSRHWKNTHVRSRTCGAAQVEELAIWTVLERTHWNKRNAAGILGVFRPTLYRKLNKYQIRQRGRL
jgi:transcriptional regulator of acetoin/glycerol metabolism